MRFVKEILTEGEFLVSTMSGPKKRNYTKKDLQAMAKTASSMLRGGVKIPAPFKHVEEGKFVAPIVEGDPEGKEPKDNAGFWEKFYVRKNEHGTSSLFGVIEAPGSEDDPNTPAFKVSRTVKDTSIGLLPGFTDGKGRNWGDHALVHVALPVDPVEPGQSNFLPLPDDSETSFEAIAMSRKVFSGIPQLLTLLNDAGISLPADTNEENILDRLLTVFMNFKDGLGSSLTRKPSNGKVETYPIMMSLTPAQVESIVASKAVNPVTGKEFVADDFKDESTEVDTLRSACEAMSLQLNTVYKDRYLDRIKNLVSTKRVTQKYADEQLLPLVNSIQMSFKGGKAEDTPLDVTLRALEALQPVTQTASDVDTGEFMSRKPAGAVDEQNPLDASTEIDSERVDEIVNAMLKAGTSY